MIRSTFVRSALCALLVPTLSCNLLDVNDDEDVSGRGARVFDPYQSSASGAIRLSLQQFNGCAILPSGVAVSKGTLNLPDYPDTCPDLSATDPTSARIKPTGTLRLMAGTKYFLNQLTLSDIVLNKHTNTSDLTQAVRWMKYESRFRNLDWGDLGKVSDTWTFNTGIEGFSQDAWTREVLFDNARWRRVTDDTFTVEILDADGVTPRMTPVVYSRGDFLADSAAGGHTRLGWRMETVQAPQFPGDTAPHPLPVLFGQPPSPPAYRTLVKMDMVGSTNPFKTFEAPFIPGPAILKVTWSQLPNEPFVFPIELVTQDNLAPTCANADGQPVVCGFGVDPRFKFSTPANGKGYYEPAESFRLFLDLRDGDGNQMLPSGLLPSGKDMLADNANGLLYPTQTNYFALLERDAQPAYMVAGPLQNLRVRSDPQLKAPYWSADAESIGLVDDLATLSAFPGVYASTWTTRYTVDLPKDAEAGTYVAMVKSHRYFLGERVAKMNAYFFQVGQAEPTTYPSSVGNCQLCHRGVLSLDNLRHGMGVDHVEACKTCHQRDSDFVARIQQVIHSVHNTSPRYTQNKTDCTVCHLTRESALRPSINVCASCHPSVHGDEYFSEQFSAKGDPNRFGNCAQTCHAQSTPRGHILPEN
ncbi:hypothetical protein D7V97_06035 [Corallococcus sp. CA053C]|uniref:cytochrome c3 family protein n=1 Tax=Corallococcus sp. CA053C TaxID=2316732 RepID=UPI000EA0EFBF|nr:cytochrome c3 family protein [Corallococcus sp. CA053C]RKH13346.1 hypothetical protein D7V97_06035 [Corallococcus sp. CA053C]